VNLSISLIDCQ